MLKPFVGAVTRCPVCRKDVPLVSLKCTYCGAFADESSLLLSYRLPDGGAGSMDQTTAAFLRSPHPKPTQSDLDQLFARSSRIQLREWIIEGDVSRFQPQIDFSSPRDLCEIRNLLAINEALECGHAMTIGDICLAFYCADDLIAEIQVVLDFAIRWSAQWKGDAPLIHALELANFLKGRGFPKMLNDLYRQDAEARERQARLAAWLATWEPAIPRGLAPLIEDLLEERYSTELQARPKALAILANQLPSEDDQVCALLMWYGHGRGAWSGYYYDETAPEFLLEAYTSGKILHALESRTLSIHELEGAARFISRWVEKNRKKAQRAFIKKIRGRPIEQTLLSYIRSTGDEDKIRSLTQALDQLK